LNALSNHGVRPLPSQANFVLILFQGKLTAETVYNGLMEHGYITRWLPGQGLPDALRITIGTAEQMDEIAAAIRAMATHERRAVSQSRDHRAGPAGRLHRPCPARACPRHRHHRL
jgi:histidinol-phosphate/aromatic aminotransferase/cobyric acid decarboxylase-like protein